MGIKPLRSLSSGQIFSINNFYSNNLHETSKILTTSEFEDRIPDNQCEILYKNMERLTEQYVQKQNVQYNSSQQLDHLQQYIFLLKNHVSNMDTTNLYLPHELRMSSKGICEQTHSIELYHPLFEYKMVPEMEARENRNQTFAQTEIWYLILSVLNGMRQFERIKCVSTQFSIDHIRFNSSGQVKIENILSSPKIMDKARNQRLYWSHKNITNFFIQQTYRFAIVLLELCTMLPLSLYMQDSKNQQKSIKNGVFVFNTVKNRNIQAEIRRALQMVQQKYSELLYNLINIMLCHPKDRPLPSQIYQIFGVYKQEILSFKPFCFNQMTATAIRNSLNNSKYTKANQPNQPIMFKNTDNFRQQRQNTYNSMNIRDNVQQPSTNAMYNSDNLHRYQSPPVKNRFNLYRNNQQQSDTGRSRTIAPKNRTEDVDTKSRIDYLSRFTRNNNNEQKKYNPNIYLQNANTRNNSVNPYRQPQYANMNRNKTIAKFSPSPYNNMNNSLNIGYHYPDNGYQSTNSYQTNNMNRNHQTRVPSSMPYLQRNLGQNGYQNVYQANINQYKPYNEPRYYNGYPPY